MLLPLLAISLGIVRAELPFASKQDYLFEISGYDPRDLLRGHYRQFRLELASRSTRERAASRTCSRAAGA